MDRWHTRVAGELVAGTRTGAASAAALSLEVAFGEARAVLAYALELTRAHRFAATGGVSGDDVWFRFGEAQTSFTLNRRAGHVTVELRLVCDRGAAARKQLVHWDAERPGLVDDAGSLVDLAALARSAVDEIVAEWRASPEIVARLSSAPPPEDDEPTKG